MTDTLAAILLGILEGLTEFIPVSSTGHLILVEHLLPLSTLPESFTISIQLGAILAVVFLYKNTFTQFLSYKSWFNADFWRISLAIVPFLGMGFLGYSIIKSLFTPTTVLAALFTGGILMIIVEFWSKKHPPNTCDMSQISYKQALCIGLSQCLALWPGMSRSASTIMGGLMCGLDHKTAASFSFIIAVPVMTAAVGYDLLRSASQLTPHDLSLIGIGFTVSFFIAILSIVSFMKVLNRVKLFPFGIYRIILSLLGFLILGTP